MDVKQDWIILDLNTVLKGDFLTPDKFDKKNDLKFDNNLESLYTGLANGKSIIEYLNFLTTQLGFKIAYMADSQVEQTKYKNYPKGNFFKEHSLGISDLRNKDYLSQIHNNYVKACEKNNLTMPKIEACFCAHNDYKDNKPETPAISTIKDTEIPIYGISNESSGNLRKGLRRTFENVFQISDENRKNCHIFEEELNIFVSARTEGYSTYSMKKPYETSMRKPNEPENTIGVLMDWDLHEIISKALGEFLIDKSGCFEAGKLIKRNIRSLISSTECKLSLANPGKFRDQSLLCTKTKDGLLEFETVPFPCELNLQSEEAARVKRAEQAKQAEQAEEREACCIS